MLTQGSYGILLVNGSSFSRLGKHADFDPGYPLWKSINSSSKHYPLSGGDELAL
jgi:hypothetical protein